MNNKIVNNSEGDAYRLWLVNVIQMIFFILIRDHSMKIKTVLFIVLRFIHFYYMYMGVLLVYGSTHCTLVPIEARRGHQIHWKQNYRCL